MTLDRTAVPTGTTKPATARARSRTASRARGARKLIDRPASQPGHAALAAWAYQSNQVISQQIVLSHTLARLVREQAEALGEAGARLLPAGAWREALAATTRLQMELADGAAAAATQFGRRFGHLAFAFPH